MISFRYGLPLLKNDSCEDLPKAAVTRTQTTDGIGRSKSPVPRRPPAPLPNLSRKKSDQQDSVSIKLTEPSNGTAVRPRPRGSLVGRALSPITISARRSGFIESDKSPLTDTSPWASPRANSPSISVTPPAKLAENKAKDPWADFTESFDSQTNKQSHPFGAESFVSQKAQNFHPFTQNHQVPSTNPFLSNNSAKPNSSSSNWLPVDPTLKNSASNPDFLQVFILLIYFRCTCIWL